VWFRKVLFLLVFSFLFLVADSTTKLSNRMILTLTDNGKLTVKNNYLTNFLIRGVNSKTGEEAGYFFIQPNQQAINFDFVDLKWDGYFPINFDFKLPIDNVSKTNINLTTYQLPSDMKWDNMDLVVRGGGLFNAGNHFLNNGSDLDNKSKDALVLTALDALSFVEILGSNLDLIKKLDLKDNNGKITQSAIDKITSMADWIGDSKDRLVDIALWVEFTHTILDEIQKVMKENPSLKLEEKPYFKEFLRMEENFLISLDKAAKALGAASGLFR